MNDSELKQNENEKLGHERYEAFVSNLFVLSGGTAIASAAFAKDIGHVACKLLFWAAWSVQLLCFFRFMIACIGIYKVLYELAGRPVKQPLNCLLSTKSWHDWRNIRFYWYGIFCASILATVFLLAFS